jgi:DNA primase
MSVSMDLASYLSSKGHRTFKAAGLEVTAHCFAGETEYWTKDGLHTLAETAGTTQMVLTNTGSGGFWREAVIRDFGEQALMKVTLHRNGVRKVIHATPEHRWLAWMGTSSRGDVKKVIVTKDLVAGRRLVSLAPRTLIARSYVSPFGAAAGFVYGDGSVNGRSTQVTLWGDKDLQLAGLYAGCPSSDVVTPNGVRRAPAKS